MQGFRLAVTDPKVWFLAFTYFLTIMGLSFSLFFPTITAAFGYSTTKTLLLTTPSWLIAIFVSLPNAWHVDRTEERFLHYLWAAVVCLIGYVISIGTHSIGPRYFATFLMTTGYASGFVMLAWISNTNIFPSAKRAVAIGLIKAMGNVGSIPGTYIWRSMYGPYYAIPFWACFAVLSTACLVALGLRQYLSLLNKRMNQKVQTDVELIKAAVDADGDVPVETIAFRYLV